MKFKSSMRNKLILAIFLCCLIPYIFGGIYLKSYIEKEFYKNSIENSDQTLEQIRDLIDKSLTSDLEEELTLLSTLDGMKDADGDINNYINYDPATFQYINHRTEEVLEYYFQVFKESNPTINFIFLGTETGGYMEYPRFQPDKSYDPRLRPWYIRTIDKDNIVISEPYVTNVTKDIVISFTKKVTNGEDTVGVLGISVNLNELTDYISKIKLGETGSIYLMSQRGAFVVSPDHKDWILKTPEELGLEGFIKLDSLRGKSYEAKLDGKDCIFNSIGSYQNGILVVSVVQKDEITRKARTITSILGGIYIITFIIIGVILFPIMNRMTRPILEISSVIRRMTDFNFDEKVDLKHYTKRSDEIGVVSSALVDMHNNYFELMEQVNSIDDEIRNIDIEKNSRYKLGLSSNNPFQTVINSINALLEKTYLYFDQLKAKNNEITAKNELLVATEEELTAQLEEINEQKEYINYLAYHDPLTQLPNRRNFIEVLNQRIASGQGGAVVLLDLDDFKEINDVRGHVFGDQVLETIAKRFENVIDDNVFLSRFGGDEFLFLIHYKDDRGEVNTYIEKISSLFKDKLKIGENEIEIRYSMGVAVFPDDSVDVDQLIMDADLAMYAVKNSGKNNYRFFHEGMMDLQIRISNIENTLRDAIQNDGFKMVYQPQVNVQSGQIICYEALLRLKDSDIPPSEFIKVAEKNGLIIAIGRIVTEKVIDQLQEWQEMGMELKPVSINFSVNQLPDSGYVDYIGKLLEKYGIASRYLQIEITENIFLEDRQVTLTFLRQLKKMGITIAIDDFGTGYSSLNYLTYLPVNIVKLDRALNMKFLELENVKVMDSLISLVHSLGLTVVAEGIETIEHVKTLKRAECDLIQGFYFSRPLEADQIPFIHNTVYRNY